MKSHELDPTERKIINSNRGISNTVDLDEQRKYILSLLDRFTKIMIKHFRKKGLSKKKAKSAVIELHKEWGIIRNFRLK